jgi:Leucine-rich repeat (LRR) protein
LPNDIGRMTRLCNLNLADNELTNLPMSIGLCQGLDRLGAGFNIDRNPIGDEKMLKRFAVGTDHLCQVCMVARVSA